MGCIEEMHIYTPCTCNTKLQHHFPHTVTLYPGFHEGGNSSLSQLFYNNRIYVIQGWTDFKTHFFPTPARPWGRKKKKNCHDGFPKHLTDCTHAPLVNESIRQTGVCWFEGDWRSFNWKAGSLSKHNKSANACKSCLLTEALTWAHTDKAPGWGFSGQTVCWLILILTMHDLVHTQCPSKSQS